MKKLRKYLYTLAVLTLLLLSVDKITTTHAAAATKAAYGTVSNPVIVNGKKYTGITYIKAISRYVKNGVIQTKPGFVWYKAKLYYVKDSTGAIYRNMGYLAVGGNTYVVINKYGAIATKQIRSDAKYGDYYVGAYGAIDTRPVIKQAISFVKQHSKTSDTSYARLRSCFLALCNYTYSHMSEQIPTEAQVTEYASYMFSTHKGNCYRYASAMAYIAKVLGFKVRVSAGGVTAHGPNYPLSAHGWCEVYLDGVWKVIDCSMQRRHWSNDLFCVPYANYPFRIARYKVLQVK